MKKVLFIPIIIFLIASCDIRKEAKRFSPDEVSLIMAADSLTPMRVLRTDNLEDSLLLRSVSRDVVIDPEDEVLHTLISRMLATVKDHRTLGVGIAAPQVGVLKNVILVQRFDKEDWPFEAYLNPVIRQYTARKQSYNEGCLSVPNIRGRTETRAYAILVEYTDLQGKEHVEMLEGTTSVIFQHEIDHLQGVLFIDHLDESGG